MARTGNYQPLEIGPLVRSVSAPSVQEDIQEFLSLLDTSAEEQKVQEFLADHSYFFNKIVRLDGQSPLYSKVRLGDQFEVDFACFDSGSVGPEWYLVEIESPARKMFTKSGRPSAELNHAVQQVRDWLSWVHENRDFARRLMPYIDYPLGYIFMGRRSKLDEPSRKRLRRLDYENRLSFRVHSLDWFVDSALFVRDMLGQNGHGGWRLAMKAFTHEQLRRGLPPDAHDYMVHFASRLVKNKRYPKEMLQDRKHETWPSGGSI